MRNPQYMLPGLFFRGSLLTLCRLLEEIQPYANAPRSMPPIERVLLVRANAAGALDVQECYAEQAPNPREFYAYPCEKLTLFRAVKDGDYDQFAWADVRYVGSGIGVILELEDPTT